MKKCRPLASTDCSWIGEAECAAMMVKGRFVAVGRPRMDAGRRERERRVGVGVRAETFIV